jgi:hypothetical protein
MYKEDQAELSALVQLRYQLRAYMSKIQRKMKILAPQESNVVSDIKKADETLRRKIKILESRVT